MFGITVLLQNPTVTKLTDDLIVDFRKLLDTEEFMVDAMALTLQLCQINVCSHVLFREMFLLATFPSKPYLFSLFRIVLS